MQLRFVHIGIKDLQKSSDILPSLTCAKVFVDRTVFLCLSVLFRSIEHGVFRFADILCSTAWATVMINHVRVAKVGYSVFVGCKERHLGGLEKDAELYVFIFLE